MPMGFYDSSTVCATPELKSGRRFETKVKIYMVQWERGAFRRPLDPPRAERRLRDVLLRRRWRRGFAVDRAFAENITLRGADMPVCGVQRFSAKTYGAAAFAARICRTRSARLLAASEPPLRRLLRRRRDSPSLPAHGRCRPVTPASLLFPRKEVKQEKRRLFQQKDSMSLRHKPSMRHFYDGARRGT